MEKLLTDYLATIKRICDESARTLLNVCSTERLLTLEYEIKCFDLDDYNLIDVRGTEKFKGLFSELANIKGPVLYWFEIQSNHSPKMIIETIQSYQRQEGSKTIPAIKTHINETNILYLGKVQKGFWGRLIQHMGYYKTRRTQGLQLFFWAKDLSLDLKLKIIQFPNEMADLMPIVENGMAKVLQPILGKHK